MPAPDFCFEQDLPIDPTVVAQIREAMTDTSPADSIALAVFEDPDTTWVIGYAPATNPTKAVAVVLGPDTSRDEAKSVAAAVGAG